MALNGKIAVVTGAAMGIGKAMTEILLQHGAKVALLDVNVTAGKSLKEALDKQYGRERTLFLECDVESEEQIKAAFREIIGTFGGIDILCNNAGILNESKWEKTVSINLVGVVRVTYLALEHMNKLTGGQGGIIVNTASMAGLGPLLSCPVYTATKHGVVGFTRAMAAASAASGYGIRFNAICPGFVQTDLYTNILDRLGQFSHLSDLTQKISDITGVSSFTVESVELCEASLCVSDHSAIIFKALRPPPALTVVSQIAECVLELVTDESKNGEALMVRTDEKKYMTFPVLSEKLQTTTASYKTKPSE